MTLNFNDSLSQYLFYLMLFYNCFKGVFADVCKHILKVKKKGKDEIKDELQSKLKEIENAQILPEKFVLPLDSSMEVHKLVIEKCRVMDSAKLPLWLVFANSEPEAKQVYVMFKSGDDLRQDSITLQMIKIMDEIWNNEGLFLALSPYKVIYIYIYIDLF